MAKRRKQVGGLMAALGKKGQSALAAHKNDETRFSIGGDLPEGIDGGIAQLVECKFDTYKKGTNEGEYYFLAAGVVKEPSMVGTIPCRGLRTQIMEPVCDTPGRSRETVDEHFEWILNELRKLGVETSAIDGDSIESVAKALKEEQPHFRFRTWKGESSVDFPNPRVQHTWNGSCEYSEPEEYDEVVDETEEEPEEEAEEEESEATEEEENTLQSLGEEADSGDEDAILQLTNRAEEAGFDPNEYETWADLAEAIEDGSTEEDGEEDGEEEIIAPEKGSVYGYRPPKSKKDIDCEVTAVFAGKQTCNLKNLDSGLSYKQVAWNKLVDIE